MTVKFVKFITIGLIIIVYYAKCQHIKYIKNT